MPYASLDETNKMVQSCVGIRHLPKLVEEQRAQLGVDLPCARGNVPHVRPLQRGQRVFSACVGLLKNSKLTASREPASGAAAMTRSKIDRTESISERRALENLSESAKPRLRERRPRSFGGLLLGPCASALALRESEADARCFGGNDTRESRS